MTNFEKTSLAFALVFTVFVKCTETTAILEGPTTQYVMIGKNATFTCKTTGTEAYWALNNIPMTISYPDQKQDYEDQGVLFLEESTRNYYNLTMIIHASMALNNTVIFCSAFGRDYTVSMSQEIKLIVFNTLRPYSPAVNVTISYEEKPTVVAKISEIPRWPGYATTEYKMNITNVEGDNQFLGGFNTSSGGNGSAEIRAELPDNIIDQCALLKIAAVAVSELYGEGEATVVYTELFKTPDKFIDKGVTTEILPHTNNDTLFHVSLAVTLPDVCRNQRVNYSFVIENENSSEILQTHGPYSHQGPGNVSHCIEGIEKYNNYSVVVQVESVAGDRESERKYLDTSNIRSCSAVATATDLTTSTTVQSLAESSTVSQATAKPTNKDVTLHALIAMVILFLILVMALIAESIGFLWFYRNQKQLMQKKSQYDHSTGTVKKVMVQNPIYSEPLYDKVGVGLCGPPQIAIPPVPPSASDTQSLNSSPPVGTPTPLLSTHFGHKFIYDGKMCTIGQTIVALPDEPYTMMSPAPGSPKSPKSPKEKGSEA